MERHTFLQSLYAERARWEALLAQIPPGRMQEPGVAGEWSIKDVLAHVTWFEREMVGMLQARALVGSELWNLPQDGRNAAIYEQNRGRSLEDILQEARQVYPQLLGLLEGLIDEELNDPGRFADMPPDWQPWFVIAGNTYEHYRDHALDIQKWLEAQKAFQDYYPDFYAQCYGCGRLNEHGLQIKSYWDGDESVCIFQPKLYHTAIPGYIYGGLIASLIDCHSTGTAAAAAYRAAGRPMDSEPAFRFLTASLKVDYHKPSPLGPPLELRGRIKEIKGRKVVIESTLSANGEVCARGEVVAVQVPENLIPR